MLDAYETIEIFGLWDGVSALPIPDDATLRDQITREAFEALLAPLQGTGLQSEIEPLAHGFATLLHRRRASLDEALSRQVDTIRALIRSADGSEITETQMDEAQARADHLRYMRDAMDTMLEAAARCYEIETGKAYLPPSGNRSSAQAKLTGAIFEAKAWLEDHEKRESAQFEITGTPLALAGDRDWQDHGKIFDTLDRIRDRFKDSFATDLVLYHKGDKYGADAIAAAWARARNVPQVIFRPNWRAFGKAAGFKAIDQMLDTPRALGGVVIFGASGVALNLADKAEAKGIKAMRVRPAQDTPTPAT